MLQFNGSPGSSFIFNPYKPAAIIPACNIYGFADPSINLNSNLPELQAVKIYPADLILEKLDREKAT